MLGKLDVHARRVPDDVRAHRPSTPTGRLFSGALALLSTQPLTWGVSLLATMLLPRLLGADGLGQLSVTLSIMGIAGTVAALGLPPYLAREIATNRETATHLCARALVLTGLASLLTTVAVTVGWAILGLTAAQAGILAAGLAGTAISTALTVLLAQLNGEERHARMAWLQASSVVAGTGLGLAVLALGGDVAAYLATSAVASAVVLAVTWRCAGVRITQNAVRPQLWVAMFTGGLPFLFRSLVYFARGAADLLLVAAVLGNGPAGWLAAAQRIVGIPVFLPTAITTPLMPALTAQHDHAPGFRQTLYRAIWALMLVQWPICFLICALAHSVPEVLGWGTAFQPAVALLRILALQQPLVGLNMVLGTALVAVRRERAWLGVAAAAAAFNVLASILAIPVAQHLTGNGAIGAASITVLTELLVVAAALSLLPRQLLDPQLLGLGARIMLLGTAQIAIALLLQPVSWLVAGIVAGVAFYAGALALRLIHPADLVSARRIVMARFQR